MTRGFRAVAAKEIRHILRDPATLTLLALVPVVMILVYGYGINPDPRGVRTAVVDLSGGPSAAAVVGAVAAAGPFTIVAPTPGGAGDLESAERLLLRGEVHQIVIVPAGFEAAVRAGGPVEVGVVIDGTRAPASGQAAVVMERLLSNLRLGSGTPPARPAASTKIVFGEDGRAAAAVIPGLWAIIFLAISTLITAASVAHEVETGALRILLLSRVSPAEIILGKIAPYVPLAAILAAAAAVFSGLWFHIPFRGRPADLAAASGLYVVAGLSIGLLVSTSFRTLREAVIAMTLTTILPSFLLSGFLFPVESMPRVLRVLSSLLPATYFLRVVRGIVLRGTALRALGTEAAALAGFAAASLGLAIAVLSRRRSRPR